MPKETLHVRINALQMTISKSVITSMSHVWLGQAQGKSGHWTMDVDWNDSDDDLNHSINGAI